MEVIHRRVEVADPSGVGEARRLAATLSRQAGLDDTVAGRVALVVTEAANNLVKHAGGGELFMRALGGAARAVEVLALDRGPGIRDLPAALRDGFSSAGTPGNGLGAIARLATELDIYARPGAGTALVARISASPHPVDAKAMRFGGVNVPYPGEDVSGDGWQVWQSESRVLALVVDGLGHGILAARAAEAAGAAFEKSVAAPAGEIVTRIHEALRPTRGAAVAVAEILRDTGVLRFSGLGNICGTILVDGTTRSVVSQHGTAGHDVRRIQEFTYPWPSDAALILHSDGLTSRWTLAGYPGLVARHPQTLAAILFRDHRRGRDDATVVALTEEPSR